ncbi:MAG TPA: 50S ribosomal protein L23 [Microscillaceae bacterium]|nr:50S ribosomal protein L23 [Microscillaceae bacterium]
MQKIIVRKPVVTEKSTRDNEKGKYVFVVAKNANKLQIKEAIEQMYGVTVESVNTMVYNGKPKTRYTKSKVISGRTKTFKKAVITVADGDYIDFYSNV